MILAERVQVRRTQVLSSLCHRAKNLYNLANFYVRQEFFIVGDVLTYFDLNFMLYGQPAYQALPAQTSQQILRQVAGDWRSFLAACRTFRKDSGKFLGVPRPPHYKPAGGESIVFLTKQQCRIIDGWLYFPRKSGLMPIRTRIKTFQQVRVIPRGIYYVIEIVHNEEATDLGLDRRRALGIDIGVSNLITAVNNIGFSPFAISGGAAKSTNQFYNKKRARFLSVAMKTNKTTNTKRIQRLFRIRANKVSDTFHKASRVVVNYCLQQNIGTIAIGYNPRWKQRCNLGRRNNQTFIGLPLQTLILQIQYKAALVGIAIIFVDEGYTSRCSFLDDEMVGQHARYAGRRVRRGLFRSRNGILINADVNAAYNILQKAIPEAFADGIEGVGLHPVLMGLA